MEPISTGLMSLALRGRTRLARTARTVIWMVSPAWGTFNRWRLLTCRGSDASATDIREQKWVIFRGRRGLERIDNLMLVRTSAHYREAGIRIALGAGRAALFRLVLCETLGLIVLGG